MMATITDRQHGRRWRIRVLVVTQQILRPLGGVLLVAVLTGCGATAALDPTPPATVSADLFDPAVVEATPIPGVEVFEVASRDHTTDAVDYPQDPPVGGAHDPSWQKCQVYRAPVRNENAVHALEHGAVWITYPPDLPEADRNVLEQAAAGNAYVLVSPYPGLQDPVVVTAWGTQLRLDDVSDPRLPEFIARYAGNGPELGARCDTGVETTES
jgi:hypothetical protein